MNSDSTPPSQSPTSSPSPRIEAYKEAIKGDNNSLTDTDKEVLLGDIEEPSMEVYKAEEEAFIGSLTKREQETGKHIEVVLDAEREIVDEQPMRLLYEQKKASIGRTPYWFLQALGCMGLEELKHFLDLYKGKLSANEIAAADLILGVVKKNPEAVDRFWAVHTKMATSKAVSSQFNTQVNIAVSSDMKNLLDDIASNALGKNK